MTKPLAPVIDINEAYVLRLFAAWKAISAAIPHPDHCYLVLVDRSEMVRQVKLDTWPPPVAYKLPAWRRLNLDIRAKPESELSVDIRTFVYEKELNGGHFLYREEW